MLACPTGRGRDRNGERALSEVVTDRVSELLAREHERFERQHPRSREVHGRAESDLLSGVPMNWMTRWPGSFPIYVTGAQGAKVTDIDGNDYVDLCLGDTGGDVRPRPGPTVAAIRAQPERGITTMLPSEDAAPVGELMRERFGLRTGSSRSPPPTPTASWSGSAARSPGARRSSSTTTATTAPSTRRSSDRRGRARRPALRQRRAAGRPGARPPGSSRSTTSRRWSASSRGDVACVLIEPALTNIGIVLPDPGYHEELRRLPASTGRC